jgi:hypothetical protein
VTGTRAARRAAADVKGGEFAVFSADEDLRWLDQVDRSVMDGPGPESEVHGQEPDQ